jgi:hypothetical protein
MTAKEIRQRPINSDRDPHWEFWLREIAAQLAEIREEIAQFREQSIFNQIFGK